MPYEFFYNYFPDLAERETRTVTVFSNSDLGLPPGQYGLLEMYCNEAGCDCRRVFIYVVSSRKNDVEAVIAYGWESAEFYARWLPDGDPETVKELQGPVLNFGSPQSELAPAILDMVANVVLKDPAYVERLKTHYRMFRERIDGKKKPPKPKRRPKGRRKR